MGVKKIKKQEFPSIRNKHEKGELTKEILKGLAVGGLIIASFALPNLPQVFSLFGVKTARDRYRMRRTFEALKKQKLIELQEQNDVIVMKITSEGEARVKKYKFDELRIIRPKKWDNKYYVICFDIPQKYKRARDAISAKLKDMEIYPLQKSVFICPFECQDEVDFIGEVFNVRRFIKYFVVEKLDEIDEKNIKRYYNL